MIGDLIPNIPSDSKSAGEVLKGSNNAANGEFSSLLKTFELEVKKNGKSENQGLNAITAKPVVDAEGGSEVIQPTLSEAEEQAQLEIAEQHAIDEDESSIKTKNALTEGQNPANGVSVELKQEQESINHDLVNREGENVNLATNSENPVDLEAGEEVQNQPKKNIDTSLNVIRQSTGNENAEQARNVQPETNLNAARELTSTKPTQKIEVGEKVTSEQNGKDVKVAIASDTLKVENELAENSAKPSEDVAKNNASQIVNRNSDQVDAKGEEKNSKPISEAARKVLSDQQTGRINLENPEQIKTVSVDTEQRSLNAESNHRKPKFATEVSLPGAEKAGKNEAGTQNEISSNSEANVTTSSEAENSFTPSEASKTFANETPISGQDSNKAGNQDIPTKELGDLRKDQLVESQQLNGNERLSGSDNSRPENAFLKNIQADESAAISAQQTASDSKLEALKQQSTWRNPQTAVQTDSTETNFPLSFATTQSSEILQVIQQNKALAKVTKEVKSHRFALSKDEQAETRLKLLVDSVRPEILSSRELPADLITSTTTEVDHAGFQMVSGAITNEQELMLKELMVETTSGKEVKNSESNSFGFIRLNELPLMNTAARRSVVSSFGKVLQESVKTDQANKTEQWQKHTFKLEEGNSIDLTTRNIDGVLQIKLAASNPELNRLLQSMEQEIKDHLKEELNLELDLQFDQSKGEKDAEGLQKGILSEKMKLAANQARELQQGESVKTNSGLSPSIRSFGYNQMEWTA
jgi:hypothetical protein